MLDPYILRSNPEQIQQALHKRGFVLDTAALSALEARRKQVQVATQDLQRMRNERSRAIGKVKGEGGDVQPLLDQVAALGAQLKASEADLEQIQQELNAMALGIPNIPHASVPEGSTPDDNREIRRWGEPPQFSFTAKDHVDLGADLGLLDFDAAAKIASSRFVVMQGDIARLHRALIQFMLDVHTREHGYTEVNVPYMVNGDSMRGTGQDRKSTRLNSSHMSESRMPSSA